MFCFLLWKAFHLIEWAWYTWVAASGSPNWWPAVMFNVLHCANKVRTACWKLVPAGGHHFRARWPPSHLCVQTVCSAQGDTKCMHGWALTFAVWQAVRIEFLFGVGLRQRKMAIGRMSSLRKFDRFGWFDLLYVTNMDSKILFASCCRSAPQRSRTPAWDDSNWHSMCRTKISSGEFVSALVCLSRNRSFKEKLRSLVQRSLPIFFQ